MSKLLDKLKAEAKSLKDREETRKESGGGTFEKINWFVPQKGDNIVRILPNVKNAEELFYNQVHIHYIKITKKDGGKVNIPVRCLSEFGKVCPLCTAYRDLISDEDTKDKAKDFRPVERYVYNVIDYNNKGAVRVYAAPLTVHQGIMEWIEELDTDISDLEVGHDFKVIKEVDPKKGTLFGTSYKVRPKLKPSALPSKLIALTESSYDLDKIYGEERREDMVKFLKSNGIDAAEAEGIDVKKELEKEEKKPKKEEPKDDGFAEPEKKEEPKDDGFADGESEPKVDDDELEKELKALGV